MANSLKIIFRMIVAIPMFGALLAVTVLGPMLWFGGMAWLTMGEIGKALGEFTASLIISYLVWWFISKKDPESGAAIQKFYLASLIASFFFLFFLSTGSFDK